MVTADPPDGVSQVVIVRRTKRIRRWVVQTCRCPTGFVGDDKGSGMPRAKSKKKAPEPEAIMCGKKTGFGLSCFG